MLQQDSQEQQEYSRSHLCQGGNLIDGDLVVIVVSCQCLDLRIPTTQPSHLQVRDTSARGVYPLLPI